VLQTISKLKFGMKMKFREASGSREEAGGLDGGR
jgi:hypothetical protein